jgi:hypothetical protein
LNLFELSSGTRRWLFITMEELITDLIDRLQHSVRYVPGSRPSREASNFRIPTLHGARARAHCRVPPRSRINPSLHIDDVTSTSSDAFSNLANCCTELVSRLWSLAVIDHQRSLGLGCFDAQDAPSTSGSYLYKLHGRIIEVVRAAEGSDARLLDRALYELAVAIGMPEDTASAGSGIRSNTSSNTSSTNARVMSMHHIVSVVQCGVMIMAKSGSSRTAACKTTQEVDGLRRLRRTARRLQVQSDRTTNSKSKATGEIVALNALCEEVQTAISAAKAEDAPHPLPRGFFDVMIPYSLESLTSAQRQKLSLVAAALQKETELRRKMMVDRALATLKTFSIRQDAGKVNVLDGLTEEARARMEVILEGRAAGVEEAWQMVKGEVVSLLLERGVAEEHGGSVRNKVKTVQIGQVPDRGGRPEGVSRHAALMPEWKAREAAKKDGGRKGGGHGNAKKQKK